MAPVARAGPGRRYRTPAPASALGPSRLEGEDAPGAPGPALPEPTLRVSRVNHRTAVAGEREELKLDELGAVS